MLDPSEYPLLSLGTMALVSNSSFCGILFVLQLLFLYDLFDMFFLPFMFFPESLFSVKGLS